MAKTKGIDKNERVLSIIKEKDKNANYGSYTVELVDGLYQKVFKCCDLRGDLNNQINALIKAIETVDAKKIEDHKIPKQYEVWGSTLLEMHEKINAFLTEEQWHEYKAGVLASLREQLASKQNSLEELNKENRKDESFVFSEPNLLVSKRSNFVFHDSIHIDSAVENTVGAIASTEVNVEEWKKTQLIELSKQMQKVQEKIDTLNAIDVNAMQTWYNNLRQVAQKYIETGVMD